MKLIRDEYEVDETILTRSAVLELDCGLAIEQVETVVDTISQSFELRFPSGTLDEVVKLEEAFLHARRMDERALSAPDFILLVRGTLPGGERSVRVIPVGVDDYGMRAGLVWRLCVNMRAGLVWRLRAKFFWLAGTRRVQPVSLWFGILWLGGQV